MLAAALAATGTALTLCRWRAWSESRRSPWARRQRRHLDAGHRQRDQPVRGHGADPGRRTGRPPGRQPPHPSFAPGRRALSQVPLGWFTQRASGEVKQVLQDDIATLHSLTALLHRRGTRGGRHRGVGGLPVRHGLAPGHRRAAAVSGLLPVPAPRHEGQRRAHAGIRGTARPHQQRHGRVRQRHTRGQGLRRHWPRAWRLSRGGRRLRPRLRRLRAPAGGHHGPCPRDDRAGDGAGPGAGVRPAVRASGLDDAAGRAALRAGRAGHLRADAAAAHTAA